jgi:hypothetical protein
VGVGPNPPGHHHTRESPMNYDLRVREGLSWRGKLIAFGAGMLLASMLSVALTLAGVLT